MLPTLTIVHSRKFGLECEVIFARALSQSKTLVRSGLASAEALDCLRLVLKYFKDRQELRSGE